MTNRLVIILLLIMNVFPLSAQRTYSKEKGNLQYGIFFLPGYSYLEIGEKDGSEGSVNVFSNAISGRIGYIAGIKMQYNIFNNLALESGLHFADKGYHYHFDKKDMLIIGTQQEDPLIPEKATSSYHHYFVSVPLALKFYIFNSNTRVYLSVGASADYFLSSKAKTTLDYTDHREVIVNYSSLDSNTISYTGTGGLGLYYTVVQGFAIELGPEITYSLKPLNIAFLNSYYCSVGLQLAFLFG